MHSRVLPKTPSFISGFSLIELLLVMALITVIGSFSAVIFSRFLTQTATTNFQDQMIGQLRKAQLYSMMGRQNSGWGVQFSGNTLVLFKGNTYATRTPALDESFSENPNLSITGFSEIDFTKGTGTPSASGTFTIVGNENSKTFTVNSQGVVTR